VGAWRSLVPDLVRTCRAERAFALLVEPDVGDPEASDLADLGFLPSARSIQPRTTLIVDLRGTEDEILGRMNQKARYNIGLAARRGVTVRPWGDPQEFAALLRSTGERQGFGVHTPAYYRDAFELFHPRGECELLIAEKDGARLAALMVFGRGSGAWYLYGASTTLQRELMPTYLIQWEAMRWKRRRGSQWYDLEVPGASSEALEAGFERGRTACGVCIDSTRFRRTGSELPGPGNFRSNRRSTASTAYLAGAMPTDDGAQPDVHLRRIDSADEWARILEALPQPPLLQSYLWGEFKSRYGWRPERWGWMGKDGRPRAAAQVLRRRWPSRARLSVASIAYCPRGPVLNWEDKPLAEAVLSGLASFASSPR
jgi:lipid II:glycine glycyltransferase (peptidoglycan interpeptide bridge formation enzyme)